jgi:hypothetical protein
MRHAVFLALATVLTGCAGPDLRVGQTESELIDRAGPPTGRYAMPDGGVRLEYATGPMGRQTWMVDLDGQGYVLRWEQVLNARTFQQVVDGMSREDLLRLIGRPGHRQHERMGKETWSWRYPTNECLWFRVTLLPPDWRVEHGGAYMIDPACDAGDHPRR